MSVLALGANACARGNTLQQANGCAPPLACACKHDKQVGVGDEAGATAGIAKQSRINTAKTLVKRFDEPDVTEMSASGKILAGTIRKLGWPVEKLVDVHSRVNTMQDLDTSLDLARKAAAGGER